MRLLRGTLIACCSICLAGCSASYQGGDTRQEDKPEELVLWSYYETEKQKTALDELTEGFNEAQKEYHLTWEYHGPTTEFNKGLAIGITQNQLPDMVLIDNPDMPPYVKMNKFEDITDAVEGMEDLDKYFPNAMESVKYGGRYYGFPFCVNNVALIYNEDILSQEGVGVPGSWEELEQAAGKLTRQDRYGFAMSAISGEQSAFQFSTFLLTSGDDFKDAGGEGTLRAFQLIQNMVEKGSMSRECINWSQNDVARTFITGECAMMENGPWVFPALDEAGINYGVADFPMDQRNIGVLGGENLAVLKGKNVEGSIAFLKYYSQVETMLNTNLRANSLPPREDVAEMYLKAKPKYEVILSQVKECISRTSCPDWAKLSDQLSDAQYQVITGESTPEEVCARIREVMNN